MVQCMVGAWQGSGLCQWLRFCRLALGKPLHLCFPALDQMLVTNDEMRSSTNVETQNEWDKVAIMDRMTTVALLQEQRMI